MKRAFIFFTFIFSLLFVSDLYCCTSAIISGKCTKDGRPLMWKHRDTGELNNRIEYFTGKKYDFLALVDSPESDVPQAWAGTNSAGFCIMNTASYNLKDDNVPSSEMDKEGVLMFKALGELAGIEKRKMYNTFNMGIGLVLAVDPAIAADVVKACEELGEKAYVIGKVTDKEGVEL